MFNFSFHTYDYARHFVSACTRILGLEGTPEGVEDQGKLTRVAAVQFKLCIKSFLVGDLFSTDMSYLITYFLCCSFVLYVQP